MKSYIMKLIKSLFTGLFAIGIVLVVSESAMAANSTITITTQNKDTVQITPSSLNCTGTILPIPSNINAEASQTVINTGLSTVTSYHIDYSTISGGKKCHYDASSWLSNPATGACAFNKASQSTGSSYATCTATITSTAPPSPSSPICSFEVIFGIQ